MIFIHGWGTSPVVWKNQIEYFSKKYKVETVNLTYPLILNPYPFSVLIGWSYGGMLSIEMAVKNPAQVKALVLIGCSAKFVDEENGIRLSVIKNLRRNLERNFEETMRNCYGTFFSNKEHNYIAGFIQEQIMPDKKAAINMLDGLANLDLKDILKDITIPTLIIHGDKDGVCPVEAGKFLHEHIKGFRLSPTPLQLVADPPKLNAKAIQRRWTKFKVIKDAGHVPFYTRPDEFNKILEDFVAHVK